MLDDPPAEPRAIASLAGGQTLHHNLLPHFGIPRDVWSSLPRARRPRLDTPTLRLEGAERDPHSVVFRSTLDRSRPEDA